MPQNLSKIQQRIAALGLLLVIVVLILALLIWPWYSQLAEYKKDIQDSVFRIQRYARVVDSRDEVFEKVARSRDAINNLGYFNTQPTPALAEAELQTFIKDRVVQAGGELASTQVLGQTEEDGLIHLAVNIRLSGDIIMLRTLLYQIETAKPLLLVEEIDIRPIRGVRDPATGLLGDSGTVSVNLQVATYMRKS